MDTTLRAYGEQLAVFQDPTARPTAADRRVLETVIELLIGKRYLTTRQAAEQLGVSSINTVKALIEEGLLPGSRRSERGQWQVPLEAVRGLAADRERVSNRTADDPYVIPVSNGRSSRAPRS